MKLMRLCAVAGAVIFASISAANAQPKNLPTPDIATQGALQQGRDRDIMMDNDRVAADLSNSAPPRDRRGRLLNPAQVKNNAKDVVKAAGLPCEMVDAALLGVTNDRQDLYEIACKTGPGYILASGGETPALDCLVLATQAEDLKASGQTPPPSATCRLKANQNLPAIYGSYAREAGVNCEVDKGALRGLDAYEISCAKTDGFIIVKTAGSWNTMPCWKLASAPDGGVKCNYFDASKAAAAWKQILDGTPASACVVEESREIGVDSKQLVVYELKCAGSEGFFARVKDDAKAESTHACSAPEADSLGGCSLS